MKDPSQRGTVLETRGHQADLIQWLLELCLKDSKKEMYNSQEDGFSKEVYCRLIGQSLRRREERERNLITGGVSASRQHCDASLERRV